MITRMNSRELRSLEEEKCLATAYRAMLRLPHAGLRVRCQHLLAGLRDELAYVTGRFSSDVQDEYEAEALSSRTEGPAHPPAPEEQGRDLLQAVSDFYEGKTPYKFGPHWTEELANERDDAWQELYGRIQAYLSSSRVAAAPTSSPKGFERIVAKARKLYDVEKLSLDDVIRRSVEEALGEPALARLEENWQPISTAPKDGSHVLLGRAGSPPVRGWFEFDIWWPHLAGPLSYRPTELTGTFAPTHWMPLPKPPKEAAPNV